jgi:Hemerythrin HHE cation binding domain
MTRTADALELLTEQHDELDALLATVINTTEAMRIQALGELADKLTTHLAVEQELFYPSIAASTPAGLLDEAVSEHLEMKRVLADLLWMDADDVDFSCRLAKLGELLQKHNHEQEDELFVAVAETMLPFQLVALGTELQAWSDSYVCIAA